MLRNKVRVRRSFFHILTAMIVWTAAGIVPFLLLFDQVLYGSASALLAAISVILMVTRYRTQTTEVFLFQSVLVLGASLVWAFLPLVLIVGLARFLPLQYTALIAVYVMGIVTFVIAGALELRRGIIERKQQPVAGQGASPGLRGRS